jgi:hypothetical protein
MSDLSALQKADLLRQLARQDERIRKLEAILQGQAISGVKIDQLSWNKSYGDTAVFGGQDNVAGQLEVRDENNNQAVILNKDGIVIYKGKMTIENSDGQTIIDEFGINSVNNFNASTLSKTGGYGQTITSSGYTQLTDASFAITLPRTARVLVLADVRGSVNDVVGGSPTTGEAYIDIFFDGIAETNTEIVMRSEYSGDASAHPDHYGAWLLSSYSTHSVKTLSAGDHTISLQGKLPTNTNANLELYNYKFSYVILGA